MSTAHIASDDMRALKTATRVLVRAVGGIEAAATVCRYGKSAIAEGYDMQRCDRTLPIDVVADLELCAGVPAVTTVLARLSGHALVPIGPAGGLEAQAIAEVGRRASGMFASWAAAQADADVSDAERKAVADDLLRLQAACMQAVAVLTRGTN